MFETVICVSIWAALLSLNNLLRRIVFGSFNSSVYELSIEMELELELELVTKFEREL